MYVLRFDDKIKTIPIQLTATYTQIPKTLEPNPVHMIYAFSIWLSGSSMDHGGPIQMINEFGALTPEGSNFLNQPGGPGSGVPGEHLMGGPRGGGSPEFMNSGNFSEPQNMQNEGLAW